MKPIIWLLLGLTLLSYSCKRDSETMETPKELIVYVGTYTSEGSEGIYVYNLQMQTGELKLLHSIGGIENPSFLAIDSKRHFLYSIHELNNYQGKRTGAVRSFKIDPKTWELQLLSEQPSFGEHPCYVAVDKTDNYVLLANYTSGSISMFPVQEGVLQAASDTAQHVGSGPNERRQTGPHAHSINVSPDGRFAFAADLGIDKIMIYKLDLEDGTLIPNDPPFVATAPGAGPRHFAFHPDGTFAYVINELNSTITAYRYDAQHGRLSDLQTVGTLPDDFSGNNTCADTHVSPNGRFLYGSNRGHDSLVIFRIHPDSGELQLVGHESTRGQTPRNFAIDPTGTFLLAANQDSDSIVVFRINRETGELQFTGHEAKASMPVCIKMIEL